MRRDTMGYADVDDFFDSDEGMPVSSNEISVVPASISRLVASE